jgi:hypothetical protein
VDEVHVAATADYIRQVYSDPLFGFKQAALARDRQSESRSEAARQFIAIHWENHSPLITRLVLGGGTPEYTFNSMFDGSDREIRRFLVHNDLIEWTKDDERKNVYVATGELIDAVSAKIGERRAAIEAKKRRRPRKGNR